MRFPSVICLVLLAAASPAEAQSNHSQVFFDSSGTDQAAYGANQIITISGNVTFYGRRDPRPEGGDEVVKNIAQDFVQPASDVYIVPHGYWHGNQGANFHLFLEDVNGTPNTVLGVGGGGFFEQQIGSTAPQGKLKSGEYDLVVDEHQNGYFEPNFDLYLGGKGYAPAITVAVPVGVKALPNPGIRAMKTAGDAEFKSAVRLNAAFRVIEIAYDKIAADGVKTTVKDVFKAIKDEFKKPPDDDAPFKLGFTAARNALANKMKHGMGLVADPPDPNFAEPVLLAPALRAGETDAEPLFAAAGAFANALDREALLEGALLASLEKYQGAAAAQNGRWALAHARGVAHYANLLGDEILQNQPVTAALKAATLASPFDFDSLLEEGRLLQARLGNSGFSAVEKQYLADLGMSEEQMQQSLRSFPARTQPASKAEWIAALDAKIAAANTSPAGMKQLAVEMDALISELLTEETLDRDDPVIVMGGSSFTGYAGSPIDFSASATDFHGREMTFEWDLDGDGAFDDATGASPSAVLPSPRTGFAALRVTNDGGRKAVAYASLTVTSTNQPPVLSAATPADAAAEIEVGATRNFSIVASDPEGGAVSLRWTLDGIEVATGGSFAFTPTAAQRGLRELAVTATDPSGVARTRLWTLSVTRTSPLADLEISMQAPENPLQIGAEFTWIMTVENYGPSDASNVVLTQMLPPGLTFVRSSASFGTSVGGENQVTANFGTVASGGIVTLWVQTTAAAAGSFQSAVSVRSEAADFDDANNTTSARVRVNAPSPQSADVGLAAAVAPSPAIVGGTQTLTFTATNAGPDAATGLVLETQLPESVEFVSSTPAALSSDDGLVRIALPDVANAANTVATVVVRPALAGSGPAYAQVHAAQGDPLLSNNQTEIVLSAVFTPPPVSDLVIAQTPPVSPRAGLPATWIITVTNNGPDAAERVSLNDVLPAGATLSGASPSPASMGNGRASFSLGTLASGASRSVSLTVEPQEAGEALNRVTASSASRDANGAESVSSVVVLSEPATTADVSVTIATPVSSVPLGTGIEFTVTTRNDGPDPATGVRTLVQLPQGMSFVSATGGASHRDGIVSLSMPSMASGANVSFTFVATPDIAAPLVVVATAASEDLDPDAADNRALVLVQVGLDSTASVAIIMGFDNPDIQILQAEIPILQKYLTEMGLTSQVFDVNTATATDLQAYRLVIWNDLSYYHAQSERLVELLRGVADAGKPIYFIGDDLAVTSTYVLSEPHSTIWENLIHLKRTGFNLGTGGMTIINTDHPVTGGIYGEVGDSGYDLDPDYTTATGQPGETVLGQSNDADSVVAFRDPLSPRKSLTQNEMVYSYVATEEGRVERKKLFKNGVAWLLSEDVPVDLALTQSARSSVTLGNSVKITLTASNRGPGTASTVTLRQTLPTGLAFGSASSSRGLVTHNAGVVTAELGLLAANESVTVEVILSAAELGTAAIPASVSSGEPESFAPDNSSSLAIAVRPADPVALKGTYRFEDTLAACEPDAPPLVAIDPANTDAYPTVDVNGRMRRVYRWDGSPDPASAQAGLKLNTAGLLPRDNYSVEMLFRFNEANNATRSILQTANRTGDHSLYVSPQNRLVVSPLTDGPSSFTNGKFHHVTLTVSGGTVTTWLDGVLQRTETTGNVNISPENLLHFFVDDQEGAAQNDYADGEIALLRVYEGALPPNRIAAQAAYPFGPEEPMDAVGQFNLDSNPGGVWSYGYSTTRGTPFIYSTVRASSIGDSYWEATEQILSSATYNDHYYYLLKQSYWPAAEATAVALNGHLATVNDASENAFIYNTFGPVARAAAGGAISLWIGLNDAAQEGNFVWSSGLPSAYRNWIGGQPQGSAVDEDYTGIALFFGQPGGWHDVIGDNRLGDVTFGVVEVEQPPQLQGWSGTANGPHLAKSFKQSTASYLTIRQPPDLLNLDPSLDGRNVVMRWTAAAGGTYRLQGRFQGIDVNPNGTDVALLKNGNSATTLFAEYVNGFEQRKPFDLTVSLAMGETVDVSIGRGGNSNLYDSTGLELVVTPVLLTDDCADGTDLAVTHVPVAETMAPGETLPLEIAVTNRGLRPAPGVVLTNLIPPGLEFVSASTGNGTVQQSGNVVTVNLGTMAPSETKLVTVLLTGNTAGVFTPRARVGSGSFDPALENNETNAVVTVGGVAPLVATVRTTVDSARAGDEVVFELVLSNAGTLAAPDCVLSAALPAGTAFVSATGGGTLQKGSIVFPARSLGTGETAGYSLRLRANAPGPLTLMALASSTNPSVRESSGNASLTVFPATVPPDLQVAISTTPAQLYAGCRFTATYTVTNASPTPAANVTLRGFIPATLVVISTAASQGTATVTGGQLDAVLGRVRQGTPVTVTVQALATAAEATGLSASVSGLHPLATVPAAVPASLVHLWDFNEAAGAASSGIVLQDRVGAAHGTVRGSGALTTGSGVKLSGGDPNSAPYIDLPNGLISPLKQVTFEGWLTVNALGTRWGHVFSFGSSQPGGANGEVMGPGNTNGGGEQGLDYISLTSSIDTNEQSQRFAVRNGDPSGPAESLHDSNSPTVIGQPIHVAVTVDNATPGLTTVRYYRDGAFKGQLANVPFNLADLNDVNNWLGRGNWTNYPHVPATFDEFRLYDRALTAPEIEASRLAGPDALTGATPGFFDSAIATPTTASVLLRREIGIPPAGSPCATPVALRIFPAPEQQSYRLEWDATPGRKFFIQSSPDLQRWINVPSLYTATRPLESWIDPGPPATERAPSAEPARYYRVWELGD